MYFTTFQYNGEEKIGVLNKYKTRVIPIEEFIRENTPSTMIELIERLSDEDIKILQKEYPENMGIELSDVKILAPIPEPVRNIICVGKNYKDHIKEVAKTVDDMNDIPTYPIYFSKMFDRILGPDDKISSHSDISNSLDYESELAVVIGRGGKDITYEGAQDYIFGYTIVNDISVRNVQKRHIQWFRGKSLDGTCAIGPYIVHKSAVPYPPELDISSTVNGELRQNSNTKDFIFNISKLISDFSRGLTLKLGDIIATGTPSGVGMGFNPPRFLKHGDVVECTIENIGTLRNIVD